jgi:murein DD-endopeptidase MepM/ murein hydrolase activator NlpD
MRVQPGSLVLAALVSLATAAPAAGAGPGGASAPDSGGAPAPSSTGGTPYGAAVQAGPTRPARPVAMFFTVAPRSVTSGGVPPRIAFQIDEPGVRSVQARLVFWPIGKGGAIARVDLGTQPTGQRVDVVWPSDTVLVPGRYLVRLHAKGPGGLTLLRRAHTSGRAVLTVRRGKTPTVPTSPITPGGVFPVQGPHSFGGPDAGFGAPRNGHTHQGQDIMAAEGTPVVAPFAGTITFTGYQPGEAGYWVAEHGSDGRDYFFAHCQKDSVAVKGNQLVTAGQQLCLVGHTGDASASHLHFEIWVDGWRAGPASHPIDPLPDLQAWDHSSV